MKHQQQPTASKRKTTIMRHKLNSIPIDTLNRVKDKQRQQQREQQYLYSKERLVRQINLYDDFLTMMLIKASFYKLLVVTRILIQLINYHDVVDECHVPSLHQHISYTESLFSDYTPIHVVEGDSERYYSFKLYYNMILEQCITHWQSRSEEELYHEKSKHMKMLLRSCFIIALAYDVRVRRFVMAITEVHLVNIKTRPPPTLLCTQFMDECRNSFIRPFLSNEIDIIQMVQSCIDLWINEYVIQFAPPLPPL
jgi:hypothetical protein